MRTYTLVFGLLAAGCGLDGDVLGSASWAAWGCGSMCGQNGRIIDVPFHELHLGGQPNIQGTTLVTAIDSMGQTVALSAKDGVLYGRAAGGVSAPLDVSSRIVVNAYDSDLGSFHDFELRIEAIAIAPYWVGPAGAPTTSYRVTYAPPLGGPERDLCPSGERSDRLPPHHFVALTGDRYDSKTATVTVGDAASRWVSFGCAGSAISKVHLGRHTEVGSDGTHQTTRAQREALLKMYVADYCGDGTSYTQTGHPLAYIDDLGWFKGLNWDGDPDEIDTIEALWNERGALCLDEPRLVDRKEVHCIDELPSCKEMLDDWTDAAHLLSANPD